MLDSAPQRVLFGAVCVLCYGCLKVGTATVSESASTRIQKAPTAEPLTGDLGFDDLVDLNLTDDEALEDKEVRSSDVSSIKLADVVLTATRPDGADLAFFDRVELWASAPGLPTVLIATQDDFPEGVLEIPFDLEDVDLKDYVLSEALTISTEVSGQTPNRSTSVDVDFTVDIGVSASGACRNI